MGVYLEMADFDILYLFACTGPYDAVRSYYNTYGRIYKHNFVGVYVLLVVYLSLACVHMFFHTLTSSLMSHFSAKKYFAVILKSI